MASINEEARIPVYLNDQEARQALKNLTTQAEGWRKKMHEAMKVGDPKGVKEAERELRKTNKQANDLRRTSFDVQKILNNLSTASTNDMRRALREVNKEMNGVNRGTKEYERLEKQQRKLRTELRNVNGTLVEQQGLFSKTANFVNKYWSIIGGGVAIFATGRKVFKDADQAFAGFEERVSNLSALTQLTGDNLEWLSKQAKDTAGATIEGNIRVAQTAQEIVDAYTVVGSKRPDLLKSKEALAEVTQEAIILSNAAKGPLEESVNGLTMALNQFDQSADQSRRIINILAAGSQSGAGDIAYLTEAMEKSGTTANLMGMEIEQWAGAIETVAPYYQQASVAGNSFDKILLKLKANQIGYTSGQFNLNDALDELSVKFEKGENSADIFGVQHAKMAELLVNNRDEVIRYTDAVTDSNTALEQAATNTDNQAAKRAAAAARRNAALIELGEMFAPMFTRASEASAKLVEIFGAMIKIVSENKVLFISLIAAITTYTVATKLANAESRVRIALAKTGTFFTKAWAFATSEATVKTKIATVAQRIWNQVQKANPIILLASILLGAGIAIAGFVKKLKEQTAAQRMLNDVQTAALKDVTEERVQMERLMAVAKDETKSKEDRLAAIKELNKISPEYLGGLTLETINSNEARQATEKYIASLVHKARMQEATNRLVELEKQRIEALESGQDKQLKWHQNLRALLVANGNMAVYQAAKARYATANMTEAEKEYLSVKEALYKVLDEGNKSTPEGDTDPAIGTRRTVGNSVYEWNGKEWVKVDSIEPEGKGEDDSKERLKKLDDQYAKEKAILRRQHLEGKTTLDEFNASLLQTDLNYYAKKLELLDINSVEYQNTLVSALEQQADVERTMRNLQLAAEKELRAAQFENIQDSIVKSQAQEFERWNNEKEILEQRLIDKEELSAQEILHNDTIYALIEEKERSHQLRMAEIGGEAGVGEDGEDSFLTATDALGFTSLEHIAEYYDARNQLIQDQYAKELRAAGDNQAALMAAEKRYSAQALKFKADETIARAELLAVQNQNAQDYLSGISQVVDEESKLGKALFLLQQGLAIGQIWFNIAIANAKAIAQSPTTFGMPWVGVNTAMGVAQTLLVTGQTIGKLAGGGKKDGGYTDTAGSDDKVVDYVHANEFVANADAVRNPRVKHALDLIDIAQRNGTIANLDLPAMLSGPGRASGGYAIDESVQPSGSATGFATSEIMQEQMDLIRETRDVLKDLRDNGVPGVWDWDYDQKSRKKMDDLYKKSKTA